jgi:glycosyltransferase involved in cell wall biosynthesis
MGVCLNIGIITSWFIDVEGGSGTAVFFNAFVDGLRSRGYLVEVISPRFDVTDYVEVTFSRFLFNSDLYADPRIAASDILIGFDYDGYALLPSLRPPLLTSVHAIYRDVLPWETGPVRTMVEGQGFFDSVAMGRSDVVVVGSDYGKSRILDLYGIDDAKVTVIPHGLPTPRWLPLVESQPRRENDHPILLGIGKMYPRKRFDILLRAVAILKDYYPDIELRLVGNGLDWESLHTLTAELKIEKNVTFLSHIVDDAQFAAEWRQADLFCHPSLQETFGFVYLESMMVGKPVVAARAGAAPEVLGDAGLLVEPDDPAAFAAGIQQLLEDRALCARLSAAGQQRAPMFSQSRMIDGYIHQLDRLIQNR